MLEDPANEPHGLARVFAWRRVRFALLMAVPFGLLLRVGSATSLPMWLLRTMFVSLLAVLAFGVLEQWPARLKPWLARWVLQLLGVFVSIPVGALLIYVISTGGDPQFTANPGRLIGLGAMIFMGMLFAPWIALAAMVRQREALARHQALSFQLERSELKRQASEARLRLLQAQVQPHFLFNTLANVRALVNTGSPRASAVLDSLIAYLRAAVPRLDEPFTTLEQEVALVQAYLELMHLRMPDRLQYTLYIDEVAKPLRCPPMTLLTLVENAVRHGIDPSEEGGRIEVSVHVRHGNCLARVIDTGAGLHAGSPSLGTGLASLRERLQLAFGESASLRLSSLAPHGVCAEIEFPVQAGAAGSDNADQAAR